MSHSRVARRAPKGQPHSRSRHAYVVVRVRRGLTDSSGAADLSDDDVMTTKAFWSEAAAGHEAKRLNETNAEFWRYFVRVARMPPDEAAD